MGSIAVRTAAASSKVRYSPQEIKLLKLLEKGNIITSDELAKKLYGDDAPYHARASVTSILRSLIGKIEHNGETFTITKTKQGGPYPTRYKKQPKTAAKSKR